MCSLLLLIWGYNNLYHLFAFIKKSGTSPDSRAFVPSPMVLVEMHMHVLGSAEVAKTALQILARGYALSRM